MVKPSLGHTMLRIMILGTAYFVLAMCYDLLVCAVCVCVYVCVVLDVCDDVIGYDLLVCVRTCVWF